MDELGSLRAHAVACEEVWNEARKRAHTAYRMYHDALHMGDTPGEELDRLEREEDAANEYFHVVSSSMFDVARAWLQAAQDAPQCSEDPAHTLDHMIQASELLVRLHGPYCTATAELERTINAYKRRREILLYGFTLPKSNHRI